MLTYGDNVCIIVVKTNASQIECVTSGRLSHALLCGISLSSLWLISYSSHVDVRPFIFGQLLGVRLKKKQRRRLKPH